MEGKDCLGELHSVEIALKIDFLMKEDCEPRNQHLKTCQKIPRCSKTPHDFKAYSNINEKYTGDPSDDLGRKYSLYTKSSEHAKIHNNDNTRKEFSIMLAGEAWKY